MSTITSEPQRCLVGAFARVDAAFDFLPPSYQADVEHLVQEFTDKMDAELWSKFFKLLNKVSNLLKTKKALILSLDGVKRMPQFESIKSHWDAIAAGVHEVATSEMADVASFKHCDVRSLLGAGSRLLSGLPLPKFGDVQVTTVKSDAETATLSYRDSKDAELKHVEFVRVEGRWLPTSIATGWSAGIADAKGTLAELPNRVSVAKPEVLKQFEVIGGMLDELQRAKTPEEFNRAVAPLVFTIAFGAQMAEQAIRDAATTPKQGNAVHCVINRELNDAELTGLKDAVVSALGDSSVDYEMIPNDGKTRCRFTPVPDAQALIAILEKHFDGASVRWDAETKTIRIELK